MVERTILDYPQLTVAELSQHRLFLLRAKRIGQPQRRELERVLGAALPEEPNSSASGVGETLWLAPGQWLIRSTDAGGDIATRIEDACRGALFHLGDVTDALYVFEIDGRRSGDLIAKGCSLDLHPTVFRIGQAKRSLLGQVRILLYRLSTSRYRISFDVSLRQHILSWLEISSEEFRHDPAVEEDAQSQHSERPVEVLQRS